MAMGIEVMYVRIGNRMYINVIQPDAALDKVGSAYMACRRLVFASRAYPIPPISPVKMYRIKVNPMDHQIVCFGFTPVCCRKLKL